MLEYRKISIMCYCFAKEINWSRAIVDSSSVRAVLGGPDRTNPHGLAEKWK